MAESGIPFLRQKKPPKALLAFGGFCNAFVLRAYIFRALLKMRTPERFPPSEN
jgi:hypothetical protein